MNPGLYSAAIGHHFGRPGNRFWPALADSGFSDTLLSPFEERLLLDRGIGLTDLVRRATAKASELSDAELRAGGQEFAAKITKFKPRFVAILGVTAFRTAFSRPKAQVGEQPVSIAGARTWVLPNPSGLNAHYQRNDLARVFSELRRAIEADFR